MPSSDRSVEVLEASYCLTRSDRDWLQGIVMATRDARPVGGMGTGAAGFFFEAMPGGAGLRAWDHVLLDLPEEILAALSGFHASLSPEALQAMFLQPAVFSTLSQMGVPADPRARALGIPEVLGLQATDSSGAGCSLLFALPHETRLRRRVRDHWQSVALHLRAGLRLRRSLGAADPLSRAEAVIDPGQAGGRMLHATGPAGARDAREILRRLACAIDRVRTRGERHDPDTVRKAWPVLASGQWTLVEHFDSDGRRYYLALRNEAHAEPLVRLTGREREVMAHAVRGASSKVIADALALQETSVNTYLRRAMTKLRVRTRAELAGLDSEVEAYELAVGDSALLVMRTHGALGAQLEGFGLTGAEKAVALGILQGLSNDEIARKRGSRLRTVANQVQSIFRKTGVNARTELCAVVARCG